MHLDVDDLRAFYGGPLGAVARRVIGAAVRRAWPATRGAAVAGLGYADPYLEPFRAEAERVVSLHPAAQGVVNWPPGPRSATALVDPLLCPVRDGTLDRVLVIHALEASPAPLDLLGEVHRATAPGGRLLLAVPSRSGLWARFDTTPFGHGQPYSSGQLDTLLRRAGFSPEAWEAALWVPPFRRAWLLRSALAWERVGRGMGLPFAGVHLVHASKRLYRAVRVRAVAREAVPDLLPAPAPAAPAALVRPDAETVSS